MVFLWLVAYSPHPHSSQNPPQNTMCLALSLKLPTWCMNSYLSIPMCRVMSKQACSELINVCFLIIVYGWPSIHSNIYNSLEQASTSSFGGPIPIPTITLDPFFITRGTSQLATNLPAGKQQHPHSGEHQDATSTKCQLVAGRGRHLGLIGALLPSWTPFRP